MESKKILVVDDEEVLRNIIRFNLEKEGYTVTCAESAEDALMLPIEEFSLIVLDVMMGEMDGFTLAQQLKINSKTANVPIIFCTAKDTEDDTVTGLTLGADDYISKPFSVKELVARVKTVLRRAKSVPVIEPLSQNKITYKDLVVDTSIKVCQIGGEMIEMTKKEFEVLALLLENKGKLFSRDEILSRIWRDDVIVVDRTVDVTITRIRKKIGLYGANIITRHGYGYGIRRPQKSTPFHDSRTTPLRSLKASC